MGSTEQKKLFSQLHVHMYASYALQRPQRCTRPVYLAQGDSGTGTETKRQVISAMQTIPQVKSDQWEYHSELQSEQQLE